MMCCPPQTVSCLPQVCAHHKSSLRYQSLEYKPEKGVRSAPREQLETRVPETEGNFRGMLQAGIAQLCKDRKLLPGGGHGENIAEQGCGFSVSRCLHHSEQRCELASCQQLDLEKAPPAELLERGCCARTGTDHRASVNGRHLR